MYSYVVALLGIGDTGEAVKRACEALELMLGCFDATSSAGALQMYEHLFKVAAGKLDGQLDIIFCPLKPGGAQAQIIAILRHLMLCVGSELCVSSADAVSHSPEEPA